MSKQYRLEVEGGNLIKRQLDTYCIDSGSYIDDCVLGKIHFLMMPSMTKEYTVNVRQSLDLGGLVIGIGI
jgi:hypothetical protein